MEFETTLWEINVDDAATIGVYDPDDEFDTCSWSDVA